MRQPRQDRKLIHRPLRSVQSSISLPAAQQAVELRDMLQPHRIRIGKHQQRG